MPTLFDSNSVSQLAPAHHEIPGPLSAVVGETHEQWWRPFTWCVQTHVHAQRPHHDKGLPKPHTG